MQSREEGQDLKNLPPKKNLKSSFPLRFKARRAEGGVGGIPPAEPSQFRSDIFKQTPQIDINKLMKSPEFITHGTSSEKDAEK